MQIGVVFPQTEIGPDAGAVRAYGQAVEELGFRHVLAYDHVVGADPAVHQGWSGPYDVHTTFHEPMVMFGYLAALTSLELVTGIIILPQRQTALVAKQAAEVDLLSGGRFRLGVGLGWNQVEYEALGQDFRTRGRRIEEQVALMRRLWTEESVTYRGRVRPGDRGGAGAAAGAAADPGLVRGAVRARLPPGRPARRRLVPAGQPGPRARQGPGDRARGRPGSRPGPGPARHGGPGQLARRRPKLAEQAGGGRGRGTHLAVNTMGAGLATSAPGCAEPWLTPSDQLSHGGRRGVAAWLAGALAAAIHLGAIWTSALAPRTTAP